jgi:phosphatidylserine/phosphatidylglycerophosphate/cardiolipin synthase-like enzyme
MKALWITVLFIFSTQSYAVNIKDRIDTQNYFLKVYPKIFGKSDVAFKSDFKKFFESQKKSDRKVGTKVIRQLSTLVPEKIMMPLVYWKVFKKDRQSAGEILSYLALYKLMVIRDYIDNPIASSKEKILLKKYLETLLGPNINTFEIFRNFKNIEKHYISMGSGSVETMVKRVNNDKLLGINLKKVFPFLPTYSLTKLGIIPGNKVDVISENVRTQERIDWYNQRVVFHGGKLDFTKPYLKMPMNPEDEGHIAFKTDPIFMKIRDMIHKAKESIFIDIFLFGGTLGGTMAKFLLDETAKKIKKNPRFKVLMLHDYATNYNMLDEMLPVFLYIKNRIESESVYKDHFYFLQANIQRHPPGVPFGLTNHLEKTPELFAAIEKRSTYYESKIDHSKVIVIDANTNRPEAYFGSKNWSDHSGGYYYDNAIWVQGPAAALVQASYFDDVDAALTTDPKELAWFYYKDKGLDNKKYFPMKNAILDWFMIHRTSYPAMGNESVRFAEANVDGRIKNVRNILVDMIMQAQSHIYMEELFIYDKYIVDALIKKKMQNPSIDIRVIADHNGNFGMNGFPNTTFMREMAEHGIKVRARTTLGITANFPDGHEQEYHQENHRKIVSVDGKVLLGGSSNLNPDTLQGSFREFGAQIYATDVISRFETNFLDAWSDDELTMDSEIEHFQLKLGEKLFDVQTSHIINKFVSLLYRSKDFLEKRH